jgi:hypothetical protein
MLAKFLIAVVTSLIAAGCAGDDARPSAGQAGSSGSALAGGGGVTAGGGGVTAGGGGATAGGGGGATAGGGGATAGGGGVAGNGEGGDGVETDADVAPETLDVVPHAAACGILKLSALTLRPGANGLEMYVALKNEGNEWACGPAFSVNVYDSSDQHLGAAVGGLLVRGFYRLKDDPETTAACAGPGDVVMGAVTDFPPELALEDVSRVEYWCSMWRFEVVPAGDLPITDLEPVTRDGKTAYTGALTNGLELPLKIPGVTVFPLNAEGRPLGMAIGSGTQEIAPGASWQFETEAVTDGGVDAAAYPTPTL